MKVAQFTKPLTVALRLEVFNQITEITDKRKISMAQWVRDAVDTGLKNEKQKEETM